MLLSGPVWYMDIINWLSLIVPFTILCLWLSNMDKYGCYPSWINEPNPWPNIASGFFNSGLGDDIFNQPNMANGKPNLQKTCRRRGPWWSQSRPTVLAAIGAARAAPIRPELAKHNRSSKIASSETSWPWMRSIASILSPLNTARAWQAQIAPKMSKQ